jgi:hypothetical protein
MYSYYVVSNCPSRYRMCNDGQFRKSEVIQGKEHNNVKKFKRLSAAKKAAEEASENQPWINDIVVIKVAFNEYMTSDGHIERFTDNLWRDVGSGHVVAEVVKSNLQTILFG